MDAPRVPPPSLFPDVPVAKPGAPPLSARPSSRSIGRECVKLVTRVDHTLRDVATALGLSPRGVLGHLLTDLGQRIRNQQLPQKSPPVDRDLLGGLDQTMVLRHVPVTRADEHHLHQWTRAAGTSTSLLVTRRIVRMSHYLSTASPAEDPLGAYQLLLDVLYERQEARPGQVS
jgi:hypothetical protein